MDGTARSGKRLGFAQLRRKQPDNIASVRLLNCSQSSIQQHFLKQCFYPARTSLLTKKEKGKKTPKQNKTTSWGRIWGRCSQHSNPAQKKEAPYAKRTCNSATHLRAHKLCSPSWDIIDKGKQRWEGLFHKNKVLPLAGVERAIKTGRFICVQKKGWTARINQ